MAHPTSSTAGPRLRGRMIIVSAELATELRSRAYASERSFSAELRRAIRAHLNREAPVGAEASQTGTGEQARYVEA